MLFILRYYLNFPGAFSFSLFFYILSIYFVINFLLILSRKLIFKVGSLKEIFILLKGIFFIFLWVGILLSFFITSVVYISYSAKVSQVVYFDNFFMAVDKAVFGFYLPFWFQNIHNPAYELFSFFSPLVIGVYILLGFLLAIAFCFLLIKSSINFYKMLLAFTMTILISLPMWYFFPALSPLDAYFNNNIKQDVPKQIELYIKDYKPNIYLKGFFTSINDLYKDNKENYFPVTTMPSMHIAWSLLITYYCSKTKKWLLYILGPYFLLNALATLLMLEHYTTDVVCGLLVAVISIFIASKIFNLHMPKSVSDMSLQINKDIRWFS